MRSLIIIEVEHGEDTDDLTTLAVMASDLPQVMDDLKNVEVLDYTVRVDVPECFTLDSGTEPHNPDICDGDVHVSWCDEN